MDDKGDMHQICAHKTDKQSMRLLAKYTYFSYTAVHATSLKGGISKVPIEKILKERIVLALLVVYLTICIT